MSRAPSSPSSPAPEASLPDLPPGAAPPDAVADAIAALPCWRGGLSIRALSGGLSNLNWLVRDAQGGHVVRFGRDFPFHHVERAREAMVARAAAEAGLAPALEHAAPGVMVTRYLEAAPLDAAGVAAQADRVGALVAAFHARMGSRVQGPGFAFWPFHVIRDYARQLQQAGRAPDAAAARWRALACALEAVQPPLPVVFGHHDLLPANILDDGSRLWLIDFEYAGFGTAMFDLAGVTSNAGMEGEAVDRLLRAALGAAPDAAFRRGFAAMACASLLREALWSMISALHLRTPGVDFDAYAQENFARLDAALDRYQTDHGKIEP